MEMIRRAVLSEDGMYRYWLYRRWSIDGGMMTFVMLNPSTADDKVDDPTIKRCIQFAKDHGFGAIAVVNLLAYRATEPDELFDAMEKRVDVFGPKNLEFWKLALTQSSMIVCAWGGHEAGAWYSEQFLDAARHEGADLFSLRVNKDQSPAHPLYLPKSLRAIPYPPVSIRRQKP